MVKAMVGFNNQWGDRESNRRLLESEKGIDAKAAHIENLLKDAAMRFDRSPNMNTISFWARDLAAMKIDMEIIQRVLAGLHYRFERHPSFAEIMALIRPQALGASAGEVKESRLDKAEKEAYPILREKFIKLASEDALLKMTEYYKREVIGSSFQFSIGNYEKCMLLDWLRAYFPSDPKKIIEQGKISNAKASENDVEYFYRPIERYLNEQQKPRTNFHENDKEWDM